MKKSFIALLLTVLILGCDKPNQVAPPKDITTLIRGKYIGSYNNGSEYFEIKADGSFSQKFLSNNITIYELEGKWSYRKGPDFYLVDFEPFMDLRDSIMDGKSPRKSELTVGHFYEDEPKIWFFRDIGYFIRKPGD